MSKRRRPTSTKRNASSTTSARAGGCTAISRSAPEQTDYKPYLGVIAQVRKDFERLTELIDDGRIARDAAFKARVAAVAAGKKPR